eukprot:6213178-Pleurochrysis_carterae.AAC.2
MECEERCAAPKAHGYKVARCSKPLGAETALDFGKREETARATRPRNASKLKMLTHRRRYVVKCGEGVRLMLERVRARACTRVQLAIA